MLERVIEWISSNKEWVFQGIGVAVLAGATGVVLRFLGKRQTDNRSLQRPSFIRDQEGEGLSSGLWIFYVQNNPQDLQLYGVFEVIRQNENLIIQDGQTWIAGHPPEPRNQWGFWRSDKVEVSKDEIRVEFTLNMQFQKPPAPQEPWQAYIYMHSAQKDEARGIYHSINQTPPRFGSIWAKRLPTLERDIWPQEAYRQFGYIPVTDNTRRLLESMGIS